MTQTEKNIRELLDREAIRDLPRRYCDCVWRDDITGIVDLFAPDGAIVISSGEGPSDETRGTKNLLTFYESALAEVQPRPYIHNHVIENLTDSRASGRCYLAVHSAKKNMEFVGAGFYEDTYVKINNEWKFDSRLFSATRIDLGPGSKP